MTRKRGEMERIMSSVTDNMQKLKGEWTVNERNINLKLVIGGTPGTW